MPTLRNLVQRGGGGEHRAKQPRWLACTIFWNAGHGRGTSKGSLVISIASPANKSRKMGRKIEAGVFRERALRRWPKHGS